VADVRRIWVRKTMGQARCTRDPLREADHPSRPPTTKHRRLSTA